MCMKARVALAVTLFAVAVTAVGVLPGTASADCGAPPDPRNFPGALDPVAWLKDGGQGQAAYDAAVKAWEDCTATTPSIDEEAPEPAPAPKPKPKPKPKHHTKHKVKRLTGAQLRARTATRKAEQAVAREYRFDYGNSPRLGYVECHQTGHAHFPCAMGVWGTTTSSYTGLRYPKLYEGAARVDQIGKRYVVDYRIYW